MRSAEEEVDQLVAELAVLNLREKQIVDRIEELWRGAGGGGAADPDTPRSHVETPMSATLSLVGGGFKHLICTNFGRLSCSYCLVKIASPMKMDGCGEELLYNQVCEKIIAKHLNYSKEELDK